MPSTTDGGREAAFGYVGAQPRFSTHCSIACLATSLWLVYEARAAVLVPGLLVCQAGFLASAVCLPPRCVTRRHAAEKPNSLKTCGRKPPCLLHGAAPHPRQCWGEACFQPLPGCSERWHAVGEARASRCDACGRLRRSDVQDSASGTTLLVSALCTGCRASQGYHGVLLGQRCTFPPQSPLVCCLTPPAPIATIGAGRSAGRC